MAEARSNALERFRQVSFTFSCQLRCHHLDACHSTIEPTGRGNVLHIIYLIGETDFFVL
jgi:hypothetical protein